MVWMWGLLVGTHMRKVLVQIFAIASDQAQCMEACLFHILLRDRLRGQCTRLVLPHLLHTLARCFVMARKGTDAAKVAELKELYDKILADDEMVEWLNDTMLLEVDTMTEDDVKAHIENVKSIVEQYKDIVVG